MPGQPTDERLFQIDGELTPDDLEAQEEIRRAKDVMSAFAKTVRAFAYYPAGHAMVQTYQHDLTERFREFLDQFYTLALTIEENQISLEDHLLYENHDLKTSLAFRLYRDGVRELRFNRGLDAAELQSLIEVLDQFNTLNEQDDDLVTLLWEREFVHIDFSAIDDLADETTSVVPKTVEQYRVRTSAAPQAWHDDATTLRLIEETGDGIAADAAREPASTDWQRSAFKLTQAESEALRAELETEYSSESLLHLVEIIFDIFTLETRAEPFIDATAYLLKSLDALVTEGNFPRARGVLRRIHDLLHNEDLVDWQLTALRQFITDAGNEERIQRVGRVLERDPYLPLEEAKAYLLLLNHDAIIPLLNLLTSLNRVPARAMLCYVLACLGGKSVSFFTSFLQSPQWYVVRNVISILGTIGKGECIPLLRGVFNHPDSRVRNELIQALGAIGGDESIRLLTKALNDADMHNRGLAAVNLGKLGAAGLSPLIIAIQSKGFTQKELDEINYYFEGLGATGSNRAVPTLRTFVEHTGLFSSRKADEMRLGAAVALGKIGSSEALAVLHAGESSRNTAIRAACQRALYAVRNLRPPETAREEGSKCDD